MKKLRPKISDDPFKAFKDAVSEAFSFLVANFEFQHISTNMNPPECEIKYRNKTTGVNIYYEWGGIPSVVLTRLKYTARGNTEADFVGLKFLAQERCAKKVFRTDYRFGEYTVEDIKEILYEYANLLEACGQDILKGDFQVFPQLKRLAQKEERIINKELYGSERGETV